jgi:hypothetical protein
MVVVEGKVEVEETASRSLVSHAIERDLNTSFVHGGKAKRSWQWKDGDGWTINSRLSNGQGMAGPLLGTCSKRKAEVQDGKCRQSVAVFHLSVR